MVNKKEIAKVMGFLGSRVTPKKQAASRRNARIEWRPVRDFVGTYSVSNRGQVLRLSKQKVVGFIDPKGYHRVNLRVCGRRKTRPVHQLVLEAFVGPMPIGYEVNHKDGNKNNNKVSNLEYVTHVANLQHAHRMGLINSKNKKYNAHLTQQQVKEIRNTYSCTKEKHRDIAARYKVSRCCISELLRDKTWKTPKKG